MADDDESQEQKLSKAELVARAKQHFEMVQKVRIYGAFKMQDQLAAHLGLPASRLTVDRLERIEQMCKRADISRGSAYVERGLVYGCAIYDTELGYKVGYQFLCPNKEERESGATIG